MKFMKTVFVGLINGLVTIIKTLLSANSAEKSPETLPSMTNRELEDLLTFKGNSDRLRKELKDLKKENKPLYDLLEDVAGFVKREFDKGLVVTMIYRTEEEQFNIYAGTKRNGVLFEDDPWVSPHQFYHAVDLRSSVFTKEEIIKIEDYINFNYNIDNYYKWTAKDHNVGLGNHFHIQLYKVS